MDAAIDGPTEPCRCPRELPNEPIGPACNFVGIARIGTRAAVPTRAAPRPSLVRNPQPAGPRDHRAHDARRVAARRIRQPGSIGCRILPGHPGGSLSWRLQATIFAARLWRFAARHASEDAPELPFSPIESDRRFDDPAWAKWPYVLWQQAFLAQEAWWRSATRTVRGMQPKNAARVSFMVQQFLDTVSPSNVPWLNPTIIDRTIKESGGNLVRGLQLSDRGCASHHCDGAEESVQRLSRRRRYCRHARRGDLSQRSHRTHSIQADDQRGVSPSRC